MHVTVVIPACRSAVLLGGAIEAALSQSHHDLSVLVAIDANSVPSTRQALRAFAGEPRITSVRLGRRDADAAPGLGALSASGAAVTVHRCEDIPARDKIAEQVRVLARRGVDCVICGHYRIAPDGTERLISAREPDAADSALFRPGAYRWIGSLAAPAAAGAPCEIRYLGRPLFTRFLRLPAPAAPSRVAAERTAAISFQNQL